MRASNRLLLGDFLRQELERRPRALWSVRPVVVAGARPGIAQIEGRDRLVLCSNDYLGLATDPRVVDAARRALDMYGFGMRAARSLGGDSLLHRQLEEELAHFKRVQAVLVFNSGNACSVGIIPALMGEQDLICSDELNHGSIVDGCRLSSATVRIYKHRDMRSLESLLEQNGGRRKTMIVTDSVFSMEGDIAPIRMIADLAHKHSAFVMIDDAHATGVLGPKGQGSLEQPDGHVHVDVLMGTLGKALGSVGGFVGGTRDLIDYLARESRTFLFTTALPAAAAAAALASLRILRAEPDLVEALRANTKRLRQGLLDLGFRVGGGETPITPVLFDDPGIAARMAAALFDSGIVVQPIGPPYVPHEGSRLRTIVSAAHTEEQLDRAVEAFSAAGRKLALLR